MNNISLEEEYPAKEEIVNIEKDQLVYWVPADSFLETKEDQIKGTFTGGVILLDESGRFKIAFEKWKHGQKRGQRIKTLVKEGNINELYNFFNEIYPHQQSMEKEDLNRWRKRIKELNNKLGNWKKLSKEEKKEIKKQLLKLASEFPQLHAKDEDKIEARDNIREVALFKDSSDKENPPAKRAQLVKGFNKLKKRLKALEAIRSKWDKKKEGVKEILLKFKKTMKVKTMAEAMKRGYSEKGKLQVDVFKKLRDKLKEEFKPISEVKVEPYTPYIVAINAVLDKDAEVYSRDDAYRDFQSVEVMSDLIFKEAVSALYG